MSINGAGKLYEHFLPFCAPNDCLPWPRILSHNDAARGAVSGHAI